MLAILAEDGCPPPAPNSWFICQPGMVGIREDVRLTVRADEQDLYRGTGRSIELADLSSKSLKATTYLLSRHHDNLCSTFPSRIDDIVGSSTRCFEIQDPVRVGAAE